jgi:hypothetical protein
MVLNQINDQFSLGPVDASLACFWYLSSLTLAFDAQVLYRDDQEQSACGVQLSAPSNVLRNNWLRLVPEASVYYRPERVDWVHVLCVSLGD